MFFQYAWKFNVLFGCGAFHRTGKMVKDLGCQKVLIVCDKGVRDLGLIDALNEKLDFMDIESVIFDEVQPDPPDYVINKAAEFALSEKIDGIIGMGGGSAMDTAKAINLLINNPGPINKYFGRVPYKPGVPVVCIATTAGTGCEQSAGSVITDTSKNAKAALSTEAPTLAIVDPELTFGLPPKLTLNAGLDALAHSMEVVTSIAPSYYTQILMLDGIRTIKKYLPIVMQDGSNVEGRERIMFAASVAGSTFNLSPPHLGHAIGHSLGAKFHFPHGFACFACMHEIIEYVAQSVPEQVRLVGEAMGVTLPEDATPAEIGKNVGDAILAFRKSCGAPSLKELGISLEEALSVVPMVFEDVMYMVSVRTASAQDLVNIITESYDS